jgi:hypothetical protein
MTVYRLIYVVMGDEQLARLSGMNRIIPETKNTGGVLVLTSAAQIGVHCRRHSRHRRGCR